jgi:hypothetical protein
LGSKVLIAFICFNCAGAHRTLGTHICFVRSTTLDDCKSSDLNQNIPIGCF